MRMMENGNNNVVFENPKLSDEQYNELFKQIERAEFEKLQHKTTIPTYYLNLLFDEPSNWRLLDSFFEWENKRVRFDNGKKLVEVFTDIENIALEQIKELIDEGNDYYERYQNGDELNFGGGFFFHVMREHPNIIKTLKDMNCKAFHSLCDIIHKKTFAKYFFEIEQYELAFHVHFQTVAKYAYEVKALNIPLDFAKMQSKQNSQKSRKRWGDKVEQQRQRYLKHYKDRGFTTYKACALWIWENDNPENLDFDTIKNHLSKADKEQAKQKQNKIEKK